MAAYLSDTVGPVSVGTGAPPDNIFTRAFGPPKGPIHLDPYEKNSSYMYALPKAYEGRNLYLGTTMQQKMEDTPNFWTQILPLEETDELEVTMNKITFDRHVANHQPEESVSRVTTSQFSKETYTFDRKGLALRLEHGFAKTEMGLRMYQAKVVQIIYSILNTMNFDVYQSLLHSAERQIEWNRQYGYFGARNIVDIFNREKIRFATIQKRKHGMAKLQSEIMDEMKKYGGTADTWILVPRALAHLNLNREENTDYDIAGPLGPQRVNNFAFDAPVGRIGLSNVFLAEQVSEDLDHTSGMMIRERQIGGYAAMVPRAQHNKVRYESISRSIKIFDEDTDLFTVLTLRDAVHNCNLFNEQGELYTPPALGGDSDYQEGLKRDFLRFHTDDAMGDRYHDEAWEDVQIFGQIRKEFSNEDIMRSVATSLTAGLYDNFKGGASDVNDILRLGIQKLEENRTTQLDMTKIRAAFDGAGLNSNVAGDAKERSAYAAPQYTLIAKPDKLKGLNALVSTWSLLETTEDKELAAFRDVVRNMVDHASRMLPGSLGIDERYASSTETIKSAYATFLDNILGFTGFTLWATKDVDTAPADGDNNDNFASDNATVTAQVAQAANTLTKDDVKAALNALFASNGKAKPIEKDSTPIYRAWRTSLGGLLKHLNYNENGKSINAFVEMVKTVDTDNPRQVIEFFNGLQPSSKMFASTQRIMSQVLAGIRQSLAQGSEPVGVQRMNLDQAAEAATSAFYRTNLRISGAQVMQLNNLRNAADESNDRFTARKLTISRPGTDNTMPADSATLDGIAKRIQETMRGGTRGTGDEVMEAYGQVAINRFERTHLARMMRTPLNRRTNSYLSDSPRYYTGAGGDGDAMEVGNDDVMNMDSLEPLDNLAIDVAGYHVTRNFLERWADVDRVIGRHAERIMARLFLLTPVRKHVLETMIANNVAFDFMNFIVMRPHQRYNASLGIFVKAGSETGVTYNGHLDVMLQDDAAHKTHFGHITYYSKAVVKRPENVYIAYDIFITGLLGGGGTKPYKVGEYNPEDGQYGDGSVFYVAIPGTETRLPNPMDASGSFSQFNLPGNLDEAMLHRKHYSTSARYAALWHWQKDADNSIDAIMPIYHRHIGLYERWGWRYNTVMWRDRTFYFNPLTGQYDDEEENTGHWGDIVFPNCNAVRAGRLASWDQGVRS